LLAGGGAFAIPELFFTEFGSVIRKHVLLSGLAADEAKEIVAAVRLVPWHIHSNRRLLPSTFHLALDYELSVFDAMYAALARRLECRTVTADGRLCSALQSTDPAGTVRFVADAE
jgi:predicted nucleic acid-binding protein